jgi:hypothetical protein
LDDDLKRTSQKSDSEISDRKGKRRRREGEEEKKEEGRGRKLGEQTHVRMTEQVPVLVELSRSRVVRSLRVREPASR